MSRYVVEDGQYRYVYGWDTMLGSFWFQKHDLITVPEDENPVVWLGADRDTHMTEVDQLVKAARKHKLYINTDRQRLLYSDQELGR